MAVRRFPDQPYHPHSQIREEQRRYAQEASVSALSREEALRLQPELRVGPQVLYHSALGALTGFPAVDGYFIVAEPTPSLDGSARFSTAARFAVLRSRGMMVTLAEHFEFERILRDLDLVVAEEQYAAA